MSDFDIIITVNKGRYKKKGDSPMNKRKMKAALAVGALAAAFLAYEDNALEVTKYTITSSKLADGESFRIALLSDLQSKSFGKKQHRLLKTVAAEKPDIILFAGDLADRNHTKLDPCRELMAGLPQEAPAYYVNGNHETSIDSDDMAGLYAYMERNGVTILSDKGCCARILSRVKPGSSFKICIAGISEETLNLSRGGDRSSRTHDSEVIIEAGRKAVEEAKREYRESVSVTGAEAETKEPFTVLMVHEPQFIDDYARCGADLIVSGHAHGGQIRIPGTDIGLFAPEQGVFPIYTSGVHEKGDSKMVISRGLGNSIFPFRVFNRPEVVVIDVKSVE